MKNFFLFAFTMLIFSPVISQGVCGMDHVLQHQYTQDPSFQNEVEQNWILGDRPVSNNTKRGARAVQIIPVVFHIFHDGDRGNISNEQIQSAMEMINQDFRRTNLDTNDTRPLFAPYAADSEIEFRLAQVDPEGNCTNGIVRINHPSFSYDGDDGVKSESYWPSNQYFNIWVVNDINSFGVQGTILGYAQFPGSGSWNTYGVIIRNDRVGNMGTATSGDRTLTHEIGHCLNLLHTFQSSCGNSCQSSGDRVCDTPPVDASSQGCNLTNNTCNNDASGNSVYSTDVADQIENYMSYNDCQNMFTLGQKTRMLNALNNHPSLSNLVSGSNLITTGVLNTTPSICQAKFSVNSRVVCVGQPVKFTDESFFNPESFSWTFDGAATDTSTQKNPVVTYLQPGTYSVSLTVSDSNSNLATNSEVDYITVLSSLGRTAPFTEDFESGNSLTDINWFTQYFTSNTGWYYNTSNGFSGNNSIKADAYGSSGPIVITSSSYDASNLKKGSLTFNRAYAPRPNETGNYLRISISGNCGESWKLLRILGGNTLATRSPLNSPYNTTQISDWESISLDIPEEHLTANLRVKFEYNVAGGNNLFIDDINLNGFLSRNIQLRAPYNGVQNVASYTTLNWNATASIDYYHLEIDTDTSFTSLDYESHQINFLSGSSNNMDTEWQLSNLTHGQTYYWKVTGFLNGVDTALSETWSFKVDSNTLSIANPIAKNLQVLAYPNPATQQFFIRVLSTGNQEAEIVMYDITGNLVKTIHSGLLANKETEFTISRDGLSNGIYLIGTRSSEGYNIQKIILK